MRPKARMKLDIGAGEGDEDALPAGVGVELAGVAGGGFAGIVAGHFDVSAEWKDGEAVVGVAAFEAEDALAEADGEGFDADAAELGDGEVAELMDEDHDAEDDCQFKDGGHAGREDLGGVGVRRRRRWFAR